MDGDILDNKDFKEDKQADQNKKETAPVVKANQPMSLKAKMGIAGAALAIIMFGCGYLVGNNGSGSGNNSQPIITSQAGNVTKDSLFNRVKKNSNVQSAAQSEVNHLVLNKSYGNKVSQSAINKTFAKYTKGDSGKQWLQSTEQSGYTVAMIKQAIGDQLMLRYGVLKNNPVTNKDLKAQWKIYEPDAVAREIILTNKTQAVKIYKQANTRNFATLAKKYSTNQVNKNNGGYFKVNPKDPNQDQDASIIAALFKMKPGKIQMIKTTSGVYAILYLVQEPSKGSFTQHKALMKKQAADVKASNVNYRQKLLKDLYKKYNVTVKDKSFKNAVSVDNLQ